MLEPLSSAEINCQHVELLPARIALSLLTVQGRSNGGKGGTTGGTAPANGPLFILTLFNVDHPTANFSSSD